MTSDPGALIGWPKISIVTPSFNQAQFLERAIRSVLEQEYPHIEYMVLDGGSTDESADIIGRHASALTYWRSGPDAGQSSAINEGWRRATGDILAWVNSDDYYLPGTLEFVAKCFLAHPGVPMMYGRCNMVDPDGRPLATVGKPFNISRLLRGDQLMPQPSTFISRRAWEVVGPLDEELHYAMDYDLFIRVAKLGEPLFVERSLSAFTVHTEAKTTARRAIARQEALQVASRYSNLQDRVVLTFLAFRARVYHAMPGRMLDFIDRARRLPVLRRP